MPVEQTEDADFTTDMNNAFTGMHTSESVYVCKSVIGITGALVLILTGFTRHPWDAAKQQCKPDSALLRLQAVGDVKLPHCCMMHLHSNCLVGGCSDFN